VGDKPGAVVAVGVVVDVVAATTDFVVGGLESDELHPAAMAPSKVNVPTTIGNRHPRDAITFEYSQPEMPLTNNNGLQDPPLRSWSSIASGALGDLA